jgi:DHA3 family macrolide efflux protein-like MFS transporter
MNEKPPSIGIRSFVFIWIGQLISVIGSQLTGFAMGVWVYMETQSVLMVALTQVAYSLPYVVLSPLSGVIADRWNRRVAIIIGDLGSASATLVLAVLYLGGWLRPWMVVPLNLSIAAFNTLIWPAYTASITQLIPKKHYGRASGFMQLGEALPQIAGPMIAGALYVLIRLGNMALLDFGSYLFSVAMMVLFVRIPNPVRTEDGAKAAKGSIWQEMKFGWDYIVARRGLISLLIFFMVTNFIGGIMMPLFTPLILDNWSAEVLGLLETIMGVGMLAGTLLMSAWGGGKRKIVTLLGTSIFGAVFMALTGLRPSIPLLAVCGFFTMLAMPMTNAASQAIWQSKVAPDVQGRVFAVRRGIAWSAQIIAPLFAAPLADGVFKPAMAEGGALAGYLGPIFGYGSERGIGVLITALGVILLAASIIGSMVPAIQRVELDLPDHDAVVSATTTG